MMYSNISLLRLAFVHKTWSAGARKRKASSWEQLTKVRWQVQQTKRKTVHRSFGCVFETTGHLDNAMQCIFTSGTCFANTGLVTSLITLIWATWDMMSSAFWHMTGCNIFPIKWFFNISTMSIYVYLCLFMSIYVYLSLFKSIYIYEKDMFAVAPIGGTLWHSVIVHPS